MARKPRIHFPGAAYHVILRGNAGQPVFFDDRDRSRFYHFLQYIVEKYGCRVHGFCLMTNHIHLALQTGNIPLSPIMQNLSLRYTKWINHAQSRTGHVFQGRYQALLLDADAYLMEIIRYIHLNPVRAGMVPLPEAYPWSGHHGYLGKEVLPWLTTELVLSMLSPNIKKARSAYASFVAEGIGEGKREEFHRGSCEGRILGDDNFTEGVLTKTDQLRVADYSLDDVLGVVCRRYGITLEQLKAPGKARPYSEARAFAALLVRESPGLCLTELGRILNRDIAPLVRAGQRMLEKAAEDAGLNAQIEAFRLELNK